MQNMQHEKTFDQLIKDNLKSIKISPCERFHELLGDPLYENRFIKVGKFHEPGLAPVYDQTGAYHINVRGEAAYHNRFLKTFGFYFNRAAVEDDTGCYHIDPSGCRVYKQSYQWIGNYQEDICVVRRHDKCFHINLNGNRIYQEEYDYVGDFKDGIAVVYEDGKATHINHHGKLVHNKWYKNLNVFHKGYSIAKDQHGWFHIDINGNPVYQQRFKMVEAFYNGMAKVETFEGVLGQIDITGNVKFSIFDLGKESQVHRISAELSAFWKTYLTSVAIELDLLNILPATMPVLSKKLNIIVPNLERLLRALWEIGFIDYDKNKYLWQLSSKGKCFKEIPFLPKAATMWARVAAEKNWLKIADILKQKSISSFESFKEREASEDKKIAFYQALLGYSMFDTKEFNSRINIDGAKNILLFGVHSLFLAYSDIHNKGSIGLYYYNEHKVPRQLVENLKVKLTTQEELSATNYELGVFCRFLQHYDDDKVLSYLKLVKGISRILLIETILDYRSPAGGSVDINVMVETGGKLRTLSDWEKILKQVKGFKIFAVVPLTDYLSVIDVRC
ncbi:WG repeat-containing protein [Wolbachia endosymbiont (group A) of Colletes cunicularius]|uniref:WG repeat-containing protein n=1 Tax=Wolbachia endosymbiont (group A) of Colletes cunicularius TaxID=3139321 RepID=UPI0035C91AF4